MPVRRSRRPRWCWPRRWAASRRVRWSVPRLHPTPTWRRWTATPYAPATCTAQRPRRRAGWPSSAPLRPASSRLRARPPAAWFVSPPARCCRTGTTPCCRSRRSPKRTAQSKCRRRWRRAPTYAGGGKITVRGTCCWKPGGASARRKCCYSPTWAARRFRSCAGRGWRCWPPAASWWRPSAPPCSRDRCATRTRATWWRRCMPPAASPFCSPPPVTTRT